MNLHARITKLESHRLLPAEQQLAAMTDEQLNASLFATLKRMTPEEIEETLQAHPEYRALYEELLARNNTHHA